jgi:dehydrogenase/reductase SDR family member 1
MTSKKEDVVTLLKEKVALVTGASRGLGKGIAQALGEAGAIVYVTGRTENVTNATVPLPGTIHETAEIVSQSGGQGIAVRCDHSQDDQVQALFERIKTESGRLDILVNNVWSGYQAMQRGKGGFETPFWKMPPTFWDTMFTVGVRGQYVASVYAAQMMVEQQSGLIANISYSAGTRYVSNVAYGVSKAAVDKMAQDMAHELRRYGVAVVSLWPGHVRTEMVLARRGGKPLPYAETPHFVGRSIVALAQDGQVMAKSGQILNTRQLAREYGFTDIDGTVPPLDKGL